MHVDFPIGADHPANQGLDFHFRHTISRAVLKNYLSRAMVDSLFDSSLCSEERRRDTIRMILHTGAKYIGRAHCQWLPSAALEKELDVIGRDIARAHELDPDIVFEACIFETAWEGMDTIDIPAWVFEAFSLPAETRCFDHTAMLFPDGRHKDEFGPGIGCPDITRLETRLFIYYRARRFIDAGFEGFHLGQANMIGEDDRDNRLYADLFAKIRAYAAAGARRGLVLLNAHYPPRFDMKGPDGRLLLDFNALPTCLCIEPGTPPHEPTVENPQKTYIHVGRGIYQNSPGGVTPSGWSCDSLPYFVELDNYMPNCPDTGGFHRPGVGDGFMPWGMDEISWFANQPAGYRREWLAGIYRQVREFDDDGYFEMPGMRTAYLLSEGRQSCYFANNGAGFDDEDAIRDTWIREREATR